MQENTILWTYGDPIQFLENIDDSVRYTTDTDQYAMIYYDNQLHKTIKRYFNSMIDILESCKLTQVILHLYKRDKDQCYLELELNYKNKAILKLMDSYLDDQWINHNFITNMITKFFKENDYKVDYNKIAKRLKEEYYHDDDLKDEYNRVFHSNENYRYFIDNVVENYIENGYIFLDKPYIDVSWIKVDDFIINCDELWSWFMSDIEELKGVYKNDL